MKNIRLLFAGLCVALPLQITAQSDEGFVRLTPDDLEWTIAEEGPDRVTIAGDPASEGFYVIRVRFRAGTWSRPHYHPNDRHVTVISGVWYTGTGTEVDWDKSVPLYPGSYMLHPGGAVHWDGAMEEDVVVEIKGIGPAPSIPYGR
ncbi:MAG: cupin domain-containing protein [Gammaproteobacteria bacterium]